MLIEPRARGLVVLVLLCLSPVLVPAAGGATTDEHPVVAGVVTTVGGAPVSGATVVLTTVTGQQRVAATSTADGSFALSVVPGDYRVLVTADSHIKRWLGGGEDMDSGTVLSVRSGSTDASISLVRGGTLRGTLTIAGGPPPPGVVVRIGASEPGYNGPSVGSTGYLDAAATAGAFEIAAETEHPVRLQLEIYRETDGSAGDPLRYWYGDTHAMRDAALTQVDAGDRTTGVDIDFPGFVTLSGKVRNHYGTAIYGGATAYVRTPTGQLEPVANATARPGGYSLVAPAGTLTVQGTWWATEGWWWSYLGDTTDRAQARTIELSNGDSRTGLDVRIQGGPQVVGTVNDHNFLPVGGATVEVIRGSEEVVSAATVREDGTFVIEGVGPTSIHNFLYLRISGDGIVTRTEAFGPDYDGHTDLGPHAVSFEPDRILSATAPPAVEGVATPGATLTAVVTSWNVAAVTRRFEWLCDGEPTGLTGRRVTLAAEHVSCGLTVRETATKTGHHSGIATSDAVQVRAFDAIGEAEVLGSPRLGRTLRAVAPAYTLAPDRVTYRWLRDGRALRSTDPHRLVRPADIGHRLAVRVVGHLNGYEVRSVSPAKRRAQE